MKSFDTISFPRPSALGTTCRDIWSFEEGKSFLNHGSFGACPKIVRRQQDLIRASIDSQPDKFFLGEVAPLQEATLVRQTIARLASIVDCDPGNLAFVENTTIGIQAALDSIALSPGDEVLYTDHQYGAVANLIVDRCKRSGAIAKMVEIPLGADDHTILAKIEGAVGSNTRVGLIDHITSSTAMLFPIEQIARIFRDRAIPLIVDGAHAIGQIELSVTSIDPDFYVTNAHKWLFAPHGSALFYASDRVSGDTQPPVISHWTDLGFPRSFDYIGSRDYSAWLATVHATEFHECLVKSGLHDHAAQVLAACDRRLATLGIRPIQLEDALMMRAYRLPQSRGAEQGDCDHMHTSLWHDFGIQTRFNVFNGEMLLRVSAQAYVDLSDIDRLCDALAKQGWPANAKPR